MASTAFYFAVIVRLLLNLMTVILALNALTTLLKVIWEVQNDIPYDPQKPRVTRVVSSFVQLAILPIVLMINTDNKFKHHPLFLLSKAVTSKINDANAGVYLGALLCMSVCFGSIYAITFSNRINLGFKFVAIVIFVSLLEGVNSLYAYFGGIS